MSEDKFSFVPEEHPGGQFTDSSPGQKFMNPFDPIFECIQNSIDASLVAVPPRRLSPTCLGRSPATFLVALAQPGLRPISFVPTRNTA